MIPFVQNHSGYIAGSLLADIGRQAEEAADTRKRALQAGKAADAFFRALPEDQLPMPADVWHLQSPVEKASAMVGMIQAQGFRKQKLASDDLADRIADAHASREGATAFRTSVDKARATPTVPQMQDFYENPEAYPAGPPTQSPISPEMILDAAAQSGQLLNPQLDNITAAAARAAQHKTETADVASGFEEDPETGQRFYRLGKQVLPSGVNPTRAQEPVPQYDDEGNLLGHVIHTGGRAGVFKPSALPDTLKAAAKLRALTAQYDALMKYPFPENKAEALKVKGQIDALMNGAAAPIEAPAAGDRVRVKAPNGAIGHVPASQLQEALKSGYKKL